MPEWQPNNGRLKQGYEKDPGVDDGRDVGWISDLKIQQPDVLPSKEGAGFLQTGKQAVIRGIVPVG